MLQRRRLSWRVAKGSPLIKAAKRAGLAAPAAKELVEDQGFSALVEAYRSMMTMPEEERHQRLVEIALMVLDEALVCGDPRAALFILKHRVRERCPAEVLAKGVVEALDRQRAKPPHAGPPAPKPYVARGPACPVDSATSRAAAALREEVLDEVEMQAAVQTAKPVRKSRRSKIAVETLTRRQLAFLKSRVEQQSPPSGSTPETDPRNPNAP